MFGEQFQNNCPAKQIVDLVTSGTANADPFSNGCTAAVTSGGSFVIGGNYIPITADSILQEGQYIDAKTDQSVTLPGQGGRTFTSSPMRVPGGLLGVPSIENAFPGFTDLKATVELAGDTPPDLHVDALFGAPGPVVTLPTKIKLTNNLLGPNCYIGSDTDPTVLKLGAETTTPPAPNRPITGSIGTPSVEAYGDNNVLTQKGLVLVDNSFAVPGAHGCGPFGILDGVVNFKEGLPSAPGNNTAILEQTAYIGGPASAVLADRASAPK